MKRAIIISFDNERSIPISNEIIKSKYSGWIIVEAEQDPAIANPLKYAMQSKQYLHYLRITRT